MTEKNLALKAKYALPIIKTRWISRVFHEYLRPVSQGASVAALAVGGGEELPHLRSFTGPGARIHAFDIVRPSERLKELAQLAAVTYHREGIQRIDKVIRAIGDTPELVVCRAPRILETVSRREIRFNEWWADVLAQYGSRVGWRGQMLVTTYTDEERAKIAQRMSAWGVPFRLYENSFCPLPTPKAVGPNGPVRSGIDKFVLVAGQ